MKLAHRNSKLTNNIVLKYIYYKLEMVDETTNLSAKSWTRAVESINKVGYSDGVTDGQTAAFQSCFDMGYSQAFSFGFELGKRRAIQQQQTQGMETIQLPDPRNINCQCCLDRNKIDNVVNLYNKQKEKNDEYLILSK